METPLLVLDCNMLVGVVTSVGNVEPRRFVTENSLLHDEETRESSGVEKKIGSEHLLLRMRSLLVTVGGGRVWLLALNGLTTEDPCLEVLVISETKLSLLWYSVLGIAKDGCTDTHGCCPEDELEVD